MKKIRLVAELLRKIIPEGAFHRVNRGSMRVTVEGTPQPGFLTRDESLLGQRYAKGWTLGQNGGRWGLRID